jgi:hypothetical protein
MLTSADSRSTALGHLDRGDLAANSPAFMRGHGLHVRLVRKFVLRLAR